MQKQNNSVSQKIKDRIFYVALIVGVVAIFSVVAVYTMGQDGGRLAQQEQDVNMLSEYAYDEDATEQKKAMEFSVESNTKDVIANSETKKELSTDYRPLELDEASLEQDDDTKALSEETKAEEEVAVNDVKEKDGEGAVTADTSKTEERTVPVVAEAEALNFNSESTISWPIEGKVMIPFSMETTVYFKTLDQYRCNPPFP